MHHYFSLFISHYEMLTVVPGCPSSTSFSGHFSCSIDGINYENVFILVWANASGACNASDTFTVPKSVLPIVLGNCLVLEQVLQLKWEVSGWHAISAPNLVEGVKQFVTAKRNSLTSRAAQVSYTTIQASIGAQSLTSHPWPPLFSSSFEAPRAFAIARTSTLQLFFFLFFPFPLWFNEWLEHFWLIVMVTSYVTIMRKSKDAKIFCQTTGDKHKI